MRRKARLQFVFTVCASAALEHLVQLAGARDLRRRGISSSISISISINISITITISGSGSTTRRGTSSPE